MKELPTCCLSNGASTLIKKSQRVFSININVVILFKTLKLNISGFHSVPGKLMSSEDIFPARFDHLEECFCQKEVPFKMFCLSVKTSCPPAENVNETPDSY